MIDFCFYDEKTKLTNANDDSNIDSMIPKDYILKQIKEYINFNFIYEKTAPYCSHIGRNSIDPAILIRILLIGYLYNHNKQLDRL